MPIWKAERFKDGHVWIGEPARTVAPDTTRPTGPTTTGSDTTPSRADPTTPDPFGSTAEGSTEMEMLAFVGAVCVEVAVAVESCDVGADWLMICDCPLAPPAPS